MLIKSALPLLLLVLSFCQLHAQEDSLYRQRKLVGKYISMIPDYIVWPDEMKYGDFVIGVMGSQTLTNDVRIQVARKGFADQVVMVLHITNLEQIDKADDLKMLILPKATPEMLNKVDSVVDARPIAVVTQNNVVDQSQIDEMPVMVNLAYINGKIKLMVNKQKFLLRGLDISDGIFAISEHIKN